MTDPVRTIAIAKAKYEASIKSKDPQASSWDDLHWFSKEWWLIRAREFAAAYDVAQKGGPYL